MHVVGGIQILLVMPHFSSSQFLPLGPIKDCDTRTLAGVFKGPKYWVADVLVTESSQRFVTLAAQQSLPSIPALETPVLSRQIGILRKAPSWLHGSIQPEWSMLTFMQSDPTSSSLYLTFPWLHKSHCMSVHSHQPFVLLNLSSANGQIDYWTQSSITLFTACDRKLI